MTTNVKYQNISIQPTMVPRTSKTVYELPKENLTEDELTRKSTSVKTKRRVAHNAWFPLPEITKPIVTEKAHQNQKKKHLLMKDRSISRVKPCEVGQITEKVSVDSKRVQHYQSKSSAGIESRKSNSDKTKRREAHKAGFPLSVITKPALVEKPEQIKKLVLKKDGNTWRVKPSKVREITKTVNLDSERAQHSQSSSSGIEGVDDRVKADKRKSGNVGFVEAQTKKKKKGNADNLKNKDVKPEKKSRPHKSTVE